MGDNGNLVLVHRHANAVHLSLYGAIGANHDSVHGNVCSMNLGKSLNAVHYYNVIIRVANENVLVLCKRLHCYFFLMLHSVRVLVCKNTKMSCYLM